MIWVVCAAMVGFAAFYVLIPLFRRSGGNLDIELLAETEMDRLLDRKAVVYRNLKDLEQDHKMGRLSEADFQQLSAGYKSEAAVILQSLDKLGASENLDDMIEKGVASRRASLHASGSTESRNSTRCPSCGAEVTSGKKFCADCGRRL